MQSNIANSSLLQFKVNIYICKNILPERYMYIITKQNCKQSLDKHKCFAKVCNEQHHYDVTKNNEFFGFKTATYDILLHKFPTFVPYLMVFMKNFDF